MRARDDHRLRRRTPVRFRTIEIPVRALVVGLLAGVLEYAPIIVMAEGAVPREDTLATHEGELDAFGHARLGGIGARLEWEIEVRTGKAARATVLGHVQRGGSPTAYDRVLATRFGLHAIDAVDEGDSGVMVALRGTDIVRVPLAEATRELKTVPVERYAKAEVFFG